MAAADALFSTSKCLSMSTYFPEEIFLAAATTKLAAVAATPGPPEWPHR